MYSSVTVQFSEIKAASARRHETSEDHAHTQCRDIIVMEDVLLNKCLFCVYEHNIESNRIECNNITT